MLCYRDMTFCPFWETCKNGSECYRALTADVSAKAIEFNMGISQYCEQPECYIEISNSEN